MADRQDSGAEAPGGLPLFNSGWGAQDWDFEPGDSFWSQIEEISGQGALSEAMDAAMEGKSAPRVWLIMHEPGHPELAAAAALAFARELGSRDQAALVLDCDDQSQALTRWAERLECEGWIDLARYGTSVMTSSVSMPFSGRRGYLLGVGSFAPTDITADEVRQLVGRLRRQADDLILVAPADKIGAQWAPMAGIRLLCWDRSSRSSAQMDGIVKSLAESGSGMTGLVGFGLPQEKAATVAVAADVPDEAPAPVLDDRPDPDLPAPNDAEVDPGPSADDFRQGDSDPTDADPAGDADSANNEGGWTEAPAFDPSEPVRKGTSGVFWFAATAAVVIVAILGVYWFKYVRVPKEGHFQPIEVAVRNQAPPRVPGDRSQGDIANHDDSPGDDAPTLAVGAAADSVMAAVVDSVQTVETSPESLTETPAEIPQETATDPADEQALVAAPETAVFDKAPYLVPVGGEGWALHLYSFPNSDTADDELAELHRRGFETVVRVVETQEKGRWWRIYVGSFATRAAARDAAPLLKEKLRTDWANPTRF